MTRNLDATTLELLEWLHDGGATDRYRSIREFLAPDGNSGDVYTLADHIETVGLARTVQASGGNADAMLTARGLRFVQDARGRRTEPAHRVPALRRQMLRWLYGVDGTEVARTWMDFLASGLATFMGDRFTPPEVERQATSLYNQGFITCTAIDEAPYGWINPHLTTQGHDCVTDHDGSVADYRRARNMSSTNNYLPNNSGAVSVGSSNVHQTVAHGMDYSALSQFAHTFAEVAPVLKGVPGRGARTAAEARRGDRCRNRAAAAKRRQAPSTLRRHVVQSVESGTLRLHHDDHGTRP
jgi:hypothetical protein